MKSLLLDSHTFLWFTEGDPQLSMTARSHIQNPDNTIFVSVVSLWEIALKVALGKLTLSMPLSDLFSIGLEGNGLSLLPLERKHILHTLSLPFHHRDPFDRMLAAQSLTEVMPIVSIDAVLDAYGVERLWEQRAALMEKEE